jgi:phosphatidylinositol alpha-mannosyltransferase
VTWKKKPLAIIPNGIRTELYKAIAPPNSAGPLRLLFVGHWRDTRKGLPYLLEACEKLTARSIPWTLDVVGDGGKVARSELPSVHYHGAISSEQRIAELYASCDVFVSPATGMESFGIVLLEAMASGRPIVCSDIAGYRHAVGTGPSLARGRRAGSVDGAAPADLAADPSLARRLESRERAMFRLGPLRSSVATTSPRFESRGRPLGERSCADRVIARAV